MQTRIEIKMEIGPMMIVIDDGIPDYLDTDVCPKIKPFKGFTPDGNGNNDFFYIEGIEQFPNNPVQIYNRWGNKLFEVKGYNNNDKAWRGDAQFGIRLGNENIPDGTYFYLIDLGDGSKPITGFTVVNK